MMKKSVIAAAVAACLVLSGCNLFSAEVTRPTEPAQVQQAPETTAPTTQPVTEPATEPSTEPATEPAEDVVEIDVVGQWNIDSQYTVDAGGISPRDLYGTAIRNGEGMTFSGDGSFAYFAGACYGEGRFTLNGTEIRVTLTEGDPTLENNVLVIREEDVLRIGMDQYGDGNLVWWVKTA